MADGCQAVFPEYLTNSGQQKRESWAPNETPKMTYDSTNREDERQDLFSLSNGISWNRVEKKAQNAIYGGIYFSKTPGIVLENFNKQSRIWIQSELAQGIL